MTVSDFEKLSIDQVNTLTRDELIAFLVWNDPNGVYTDEDSEAEGIPPLQVASARFLVTKAIQESL